MKKIIALALCLMLAVCSVAALAENTETNVNTVSGSLGTNLFTWTVPEGYEASTVTSSDGSMYVYFMPADETRPQITGRFVMSDTEEDLSSKAVSELSSEQQEALIAALLEDMDFGDPAVSFTKTSNGMEVITMDENNDESDYASLMFVQNGYMAEMSVWHFDMSKVTEEDINAVLGIIESMTVTEGAGTAVNEVEGLTVLYAAPEGYSISYDKYEDGTLLVYMTPEDDTKAFYTAMMTRNETVPNGVRLNDLSAEDKDLFVKEIAQNYNDPTITNAVTGEGTELYIINENGCETDYAEICTIYQGYDVTLFIAKEDGSAITEEEIQQGVDICTKAIITPEAI